ncbi:type III-B CRISPR module-associated protein Cmr5 [Methanothrix sp.]|jgi:CRISPR-associated protein Cmr5|uniref:type III-B CRISPR module-associated protein Cmr5 n=1 Tax=Methanothrix sp. TaxID=90426 RepID=UPI0032AF66C5
MVDKYQTRQQKRAQKAYDCVLTRGDKDEDYTRLAKRFPALVQSCGLAQALAFISAKEGQIGRDYIGHLSQVMDEQGDLGETSRKSDLMKYQRLTYEAIESATWLKRYSEALLGTD